MNMTFTIWDKINSSCTFNFELLELDRANLSPVKDHMMSIGSD